MLKEQKALVAEYITGLSDSDLCFLSSRLIDRLGGDLPDALNFMSKNPKMDECLASANGATELFNSCDSVRDVCSKELKRRNISLRFYLG